VDALSLKEASFLAKSSAPMSSSSTNICANACRDAQTSEEAFLAGGFGFGAGAFLDAAALAGFFVFAAAVAIYFR
jgi:hypothetical protein